MKTLPINIPIAEINAFCQRYKIRKLSLFGSILRDDFTAESDVDFLVEFDPENIPGWEIITMEDELSSLLQRQVDLRTPKDLSPYFRNEVLTQAMVIYE